MLIVALRGAGFRNLVDLARALGMPASTLRLVRCGAARLTEKTRARIAAALRLPSEHVDAVFLTKGGA